MAPILGIYASQISGHLFAPSGAYDSIATTTLGSATSSITFSSIPQTYTHLQIRGIGRSSTANANITLRVNSDTSSSYTEHYLYGNGATVAAGGAVAGTFAFLGTNAPSSATASVFGTSIMDILDYTNTNKYTTFRNLSGYDSNGSGQMWLKSSVFIKTTAISSITLTVEGGGNFAQYSSYALFGIKGA
jgi:hypothetical protein